MMVQLVEVLRALNHSNGGTNAEQSVYELKEISINPSWVVHVRPDRAMKGNLSEGLLPARLDKRSEFTRISLNSGQHGEEVTVVGDISVIREKLNNSARQLLKG